MRSAVECSWRIRKPCPFLDITCSQRTRRTPELQTAQAELDRLGRDESRAFVLNMTEIRCAPPADWHCLKCTAAHGPPRLYQLLFFLGSMLVGQAVLQKVIAKLGGPYAAAERLGVSPSLINRFLGGTVPVPDRVLLQAVDIVLDEFQQLPSGESQPFDRSPS